MKAHKKRGQVVLLMGMMATTFVIMFGLVVSIGHLVQAKINLQNSVDLAAMAGASYQARFLNTLSVVNYRFRQSYKWTLFDIYYTQSRFNQGLIDAVRGGGGPFSLIPDSNLNITFGICQQAYGYVPYPAAGEQPGDRLKDDFDLCQNVTGTGAGRLIPKFGPSLVLVPDPRIIITNMLIADLAKKAEDIFKVGSENNEKYFDYVIRELRNRQVHQRGQFNSVLSQMQSSFGAAPGPVVGAVPGDAVIARTFRENLVAANGNAELSYLNSSESLAPPTNEFEETMINFDFWAIRFNDVGGAHETRPILKTATGVTVGMSRKRDGSGEHPLTPTMVILKATARPKLLFWPRSLTPTISAIAVARPFGSKIGPPKSVFLTENPAAASTKANMSLYVGDTWGGGGIPGIGHVAFARTVLSLLPSGLGSGRNELRPDASGGCPNSYGCMARSPTHFEGIMFNIFPDSEGGPRYQLAKSDLGSASVFGGGYVLLDRPGSLNGLHGVQFAGIAPYYATADSAATSWAPAAALGDPSSRRVGYSIKLLSMQQACAELGLGSGGAGGSELTYFCQIQNRPTH